MRKMGLKGEIAVMEQQTHKQSLTHMHIYPFPVARTQPSLLLAIMVPFKFIANIDLHGKVVVLFVYYRK